jgi:hypothetical protein
VRSHAKAAPVGSNSGRGAGPGSLCRSCLPSSFVLVLLAAACLLPSSALAAEARVQIGSFGPDGTSATQFEFPGAVAVDQGTHDIYVADYGNGKVEKFNENGTPTNFSALASNEIGGFSFFSGEALNQIAVNSTSHDFYVAEYNNGVIKAFHQSGQPAEFTAGSGAGSNELTGASAFGVCGVAVDANGLIYMGDFATGVHVFKPNGEELTSFPIVEEPCNLAVDSNGAVYASHYPFFGEGRVEKFTPSEFPVTASTTYPASGEVVDPSPAFAVAVDPSSDDVYVNHADHISIYDSSGAFQYEFGTPTASEGIAVDGATEKAYAPDTGSKRVQVFGPPFPLPTVSTEDADGVTTSVATLRGTVNPEGKQLIGCHFEWGATTSYGNSAACVPAAGSIPPDSTDHAVEAEISGLSPNVTYHFRLVAATAEGTSNGNDRLLTTAIGAPVVSEQRAETVGASDAIVSAKINPKGAPTTYHIEYGLTAAYGQSTSESAPIGFSGDDSAHGVSVHIGGLSSGTAYHFRFVATSPAGEAEGPDTTFATYPPPPSFGPCPNDQFRSGFGARLPDCRAYEQATPVNKQGANIQGGVDRFQVSNAGDRVTFFLDGGLPTTGGSASLGPFMASRGPNGWSSDGLLPATDPGYEARVMGWSEDLSTSVSVAPGPGNAGGALYLRDADTAAFQLGTTGFPNPYYLPGIAGFAADTSHFVFSSSVSLLPGVPAATSQAYDLNHGTLSFVGRVPGGSATSCDDATGPACVPAPGGSILGSQFGTQGAPVTSSDNAISRDGSKVFFSARSTGQLYAREDATKTTRISASQRAVPDPNGEKPPTLMPIAADGSKAFFLSCEKLTDDSTAVSTAANTCTSGQGQDLYSYETDSGELTDLTVDSNPGDPKGADVQGVLGTSEDGSYVYFVANGVLAPGASPGNCPTGGTTCNLYVSHDGTITFIAQVSANDNGDWTFGNYFAVKSSRVSAGGDALLFSSIRSLTGSDNTESTASACGEQNHSGDHCLELFRYSAPDEELTCVSCNPAGTPPSGDAVVGNEDNLIVISPYNAPFYTRNLSADGKRAFFQTPDALLPTDTNGVTDVYEWEAEGAGSCHTAGGCIYLLSSGTSPEPSRFVDASADGDHAFILTDQQLVPTDHDELFDIYDVGVGGGLAAQHVLAPPTCAGAACQANPAPPPDQPAASAVFSGPGNAHKPAVARKCPKGSRKVRRAGKVRCQKASKHSKQHKRHSNRGGSK